MYTRTTGEDEVSAKVILASKSNVPGVPPLITIQIRAHRFIMAERNRHRVLSLSDRSSRAVSTKRLIEEVRTKPALPVKWLKNKIGMVGGEPMTPEEIQVEVHHWMEGAFWACHQVEQAMKRGLHKQWTNRPLEPYMYFDGVMTGTDWENFLALRTAEDAQPEFKVLADKILEAIRGATYQVLKPGEWHMPFIDDKDCEAADRYLSFAQHLGQLVDVDLQKVLLDMSAAHIARGSTKIYESNRKSLVVEDVKLAKFLEEQVHMSPFEHQATPDYSHPQQQERWGNFTGWIQNRKHYPNENRSFQI